MLDTPSTFRSEHGFSLPELMISVALLLIISASVTSGLLQMTNSQKTIWNRTQLHAGVRSATELLQQEVGQAGRVTLPGTVTLTAPIAVNTNIATVSSTLGMFAGERILIEPGSNEETVQIAAVNSATQFTIVRSVDSADSTVQVGTPPVSATWFVNAHPIGAKVRVSGGFAGGIVPPAPGFLNGSTPSVLKLYGDVNGDGNMVYVEYTCDPAPGTGNLYRNAMPFDQTTAKLPPDGTQVLLSSIQPNPNNTPCFTYMPNPLPVVTSSGIDNTYVLDVAITLTVQTQTRDPITNQFQLETKALLNVSPRNVFNVWQLASSGIHAKVQPMPPTVAALLP